MIASGQTLSALPTGSTSSLLLKVRDLQTHFPIRTGTIKAVDGVSFDVQRGKTLCVVGESGSGKSVTARSILQIVDEPGRIMGGSMLLHRADGSSLDLAQLGQRSREIRAVRGAEIAMIFQEPMTSLNPVYTAPAVSTQSTIQLIVRVTNPNGCGSSDTVSISIDPALQGKTFSGTLRYDNNAGTPINDARIKLINTQNQVITAEVNSQGVYFFPNLANGTYSVSIDTIRKTSGGVTSADVTMINNYVVSISAARMFYQNHFPFSS